MSRRALVPVILAITLVLGACEGPGVLTVDQEPSLALVPVNLNGAEILETLTITVTAADLTTPLVFNIIVQNGSASDTIAIPAGSDRTIEARAYDGGGIETHRGSETVDLVEDLNPAVVITMVPLVGTQPIVVIVGGIDITITPSIDTISVGGSTLLAATVTDDQGDTLMVDVAWATLSPAVATVGADGLVTGVLAGDVQIVATYGGVGAVADVSVDGPSPYTYALSFDGIDDYVGFGALSGFDANGSLSMETVFRWDGANAANREQYVMSFFLTSGGLAFLVVDASGTLLAQIAQCNCAADDASRITFDPQAGVWYSVLYTYDRSTGDARLYVDGTLVGQANYPFTGYYLANSSNTTMGGYSFVNEPAKLNGSIAFARIVNAVVSPTLFPSLEPVHAQSLYHVTFSEGSGTVLNDQSVNGNDGTIVGAVWSVDVPGG
jgi:concanavalin A-like lectin/glucanase superfamily protein/Big-like domain-containing protein